MTTRASAARRRASSCPPTPPILDKRRSAPRTSPSTSTTTTTTTATSRPAAALRNGRATTPTAARGSTRDTRKRTSPRCTVRIDRCVRDAPEDLAALRPDIVVTHEPSRTVVVVDVTVPFDNTFSALERARLARIEKYAPLAAALNRNGCAVYVNGFVVGALGAWHPHNEGHFPFARLAALMRRLMVSETIAWFRDIYIEHVTGIRQYSSPESAAPGAAALATVFSTSTASVNIATSGATVALESISESGTIRRPLPGTPPPSGTST
ncbi:unnamed protein product, partial [Heterotrigona itama]